jgi:hypothetical protein
MGYYIPEDDSLHSVALYASHAALPMVISKFSSNAAR